ncbi:MAG TPA: tetratricopeptide repeat protein [Chthoniobacter sp.]|nr:tetratricopeptide repeat protein [Chthoniobacter sp.]
MKWKFQVRLLLLGLLSIPAFAGPLEDGLAAYKQSDYLKARSLLHPLADQGNPEAQYLVGAMYLRGWGLPQDLRTGLEWERRAAKQGLAEAQAVLGIAYRDGQGVKRDHAKAMEWLLKAAGQNNQVAQRTISEIYERGQGVRKNPAEAQKWYAKSIRRPELPTEVIAGLEGTPAITLYSLQPWGGPDIPEWDFHRHHVLGQVALDKAQAQIAIGALKDAVSAGNANLHSGCLINPRHALRFQADGHTFDILICYQCGQLEVYKDDQSLRFSGMIGGKPEVLNNLLKAAAIPLADTPSALLKSYEEEAAVALEKAKEGDAQAQNVIARMLLKGRGVKMNVEEGIQWLAKAFATSPDSPEFQIALGDLYERGQDVAEDQKAAMELFRKAAAQGNAEALYHMAELYDWGGGVKKDPAKAIELFRQAAEAGNVEAQFEIGVRLAQGRDVKEDYAEALQWLRKAAEKNQPEALGWMSAMYERGWGVPKDMVEAYCWDRLAVEYHTTSGNRVSTSLTAEQLAVVEKRVTEWKATHPARPAHGLFH